MAKKTSAIQNVKKFTNVIGSFGENLASARLSRTVGGTYRHPLFQATFLGDKYPTVDLLVDLLDSDSKSLGFFFAQVKSTASADDKAKRLSVNVELDKYNRLAEIPVPTYLIGVDTETEKVYIIGAARRVRSQFSSISRKHDLGDEAVRVKLYKEVLTNWKKCKAAFNKLKTDFGNGS